MGDKQRCGFMRVEASAVGEIEEDESERVRGRVGFCFKAGGEGRPFRSEEGALQRSGERSQQREQQVQRP